MNDPRRARTWYREILLRFSTHLSATFGDPLEFRPLGCRALARRCQTSVPIFRRSESIISILNRLPSLHQPPSPSSAILSFSHRQTISLSLGLIIHREMPRDRKKKTGPNVLEMLQRQTRKPGPSAPQVPPTNIGADIGAGAGQFSEPPARDSTSSLLDDVDAGRLAEPTSGPSSKPPLSFGGAGQFTESPSRASISSLPDDGDGGGFAEPTSGAFNRPPLSFAGAGQFTESPSRASTSSLRDDGDAGGSVGSPVRRTPGTYYLSKGKLHLRQTSLPNYFTGGRQRQPSITSLPGSVTSSNQRHEGKNRWDASAPASSVGGSPGGASSKKKKSFGKELFENLKNYFPLVELLHRAIRDSRKGNSYDMTLLEEKLLRLSAQGPVYKSSDFSNLSLDMVLAEFGLLRVPQDTFTIPFWSPLNLLDQCPSLFKTLTPDELFWANVGRYDRHLASPVSGNEALARIRVDLVILTVLDVLVSCHFHFSLLLF